MHGRHSFVIRSLCRFAPAGFGGSEFFRQTWATAMFQTAITQLCSRKRGRTNHTWRSELGRGIPFLDQMTNSGTQQLERLLRRIIRPPLAFWFPRKCNGRRNGAMATECSSSLRGRYKLLRV